MPVTVPPLKATDSAGAMPLFAASAVRTLARTATFMPMKPVMRRQHRADHEPDRHLRRPGRSVQWPATAIATATTTATACDRRVLAAQVGRRALLDRRGDLAHAVGARRLRQHPAGQQEPVYNGRDAAHERDQDGMVNQ